MKLSKRRILPFLLAVCTLVGCLLPGITPANAAACDFPNTYVNTGNQPMDLVGVALTQVGYTEGDNNDTKYGAWYPAANQAWCATFVSWCIAQAQLPESVVSLSAVADPGPGYFNIPYHDGASYTPKPGDIFFSKIFTHVGIVVAVDGDYFYTAEGNTNIHDPDDPNPPEREGLYVMSNRRLTSKYYFGTPNYTSCQCGQTYTKGQDAAHPHTTYWTCTACGKKVYTSYNNYVSGCSSCLPCGCTPTDSYYKVDVSSEYCLLRTGHGSGYDDVGGVVDGGVVHVLGISGSWAYAEYDGKRGHINTSYIDPHYGPPAAPTLTADQAEYVQKDTAKLSWNLPENTGSFLLHIYKGNTLLVNENIGTVQSYELPDLAPGEYEVKLYATNDSGISPESSLKLTVRDVYRVSFDARGGSNAPEMQAQTLREIMTLSTTVPTLADHTFLGWTDNADGNFVTYKPGDSFIADNDVTLYAVWKKNSATLDTLSIDRLPSQTRYLKGDKLNTTGLTLKLGYSDGSGQLVTDGFTTSDFASDMLGTKTVTVTYGDKTVTYDVQIMTYIPGDVNEDRIVNRDDVMQLLWHISFPEKFPVNVNADFKEDGKVNRDDVMQLLWHVAFPDKFSVPDANTHTHKWTEATCHEPKFCTTCGTTEGTAAGHTWQDVTCTVPKTCKTCGATEGTAAGHTWQDATCTLPKTCKTCGATEGNAAGHTWKDATCTAPKTCSTCGATEGSAAGHAWKDATCTDPKTCNTCGTTEGNAAGHTWQDATCTTPKTCGTCGATEGETLGHNHVENTETGEFICSRCGDTVVNDDSSTAPSDDATPPEDTTALDTDTPEE